MPVYSVCKTCGYETSDSLCAVCLANENETLKEICKAFHSGLDEYWVQQPEGQAALMLYETVKED